MKYCPTTALSSQEAAGNSTRALLRSSLTYRAVGLPEISFLSQLSRLPPKFTVVSEEVFRTVLIKDEGMLNANVPWFHVL